MRKSEIDLCATEITSLGAFVGGDEEGVWLYQSVKIENILPLKPFAMVYCKG